MNVGIRDGDLFLQDDPWVGTNHQMDTAVFGAGVRRRQAVRLDLQLHPPARGRRRRSRAAWCKTRSMCYTEPTFMPPIKLVESGVMREDVVDAWTRRSRLPELMTLELNSQVAGYNTARDGSRDHRPLWRGDRQRRHAQDDRRHRDGRASVCAAARRDVARRSATSRARSQRPQPVQLCLSFDKKGDRLLVRNEGTDPASARSTPPPASFGPQCQRAADRRRYDQYLCAAGVLRRSISTSRPAPSPPRTTRRR